MSGLTIARPHLRLEGRRERFAGGLPQRTAVRKDPMPVGTERGQRNVVRFAAGANEGIEHPAAEVGCKELVVCRIEPLARITGGRTVTAGGVDQAPRRAVAEQRIPAASTGEIEN